MIIKKILGIIKWVLFILAEYINDAFFLTTTDLYKSSDERTFRNKSESVFDNFWKKINLVVVNVHRYQVKV